VRRPSVGIADLLVLAAALGVPTTALLVPLGMAQVGDKEPPSARPEPLPGQQVTAGAAISWLTGMAQGRPLPELSAALLRVIELLERVEDLSSGYLRTRTFMETLEEDAALGSFVKSTIEELKPLRAELRRLGVQALPDLPAELRIVDADLPTDVEIDVVPKPFGYRPQRPSVPREQVSDG
jgi:hypothetical protein